VDLRDRNCAHVCFGLRWDTCVIATARPIRFDALFYGTTDEIIPESFCMPCFDLINLLVQSNDRQSVDAVETFYSFVCVVGDTSILSAL
jgi:hypothetical protein